MTADRLDRRDSRRTTGRRTRARQSDAWKWDSRVLGEGLAIVIMLVLGGGSSHTPLTRLGAELIGLALIAGPLMRVQWHQVAGPDRALVWLGAALAGLALVQLVPLPASWWTAMPGRAPFVAGDRLLFGHAIARPWSLDPDETIASILFVVPGLALWLRTRAIPAFAERATIAFLVFLTASFALSVIQATGTPGAYHLYNNTHLTLPTGFFANRNHQSIAMDCGIVLAAMLERRWVRDERHEQVHGWLFGAAALMFATGALLTGSRAGAVLMLPALVAGILVAYGTGRKGRIALGVALAIVVVLALVLVLRPGGQLAVFTTRNPLDDDDRYLFWPAVVDMVKLYAPWGTGLGTFPNAYEVTEPRALLSPLRLNHAHNDWLEFLADAGVPGALFALAFVGWLAGRLLTAGRAGLPPMVRGAGAIIALLLVHGAYDYPLRTIALGALFILMTAQMAPAAAIPVLVAQTPGLVRRCVVWLGIAAVALMMILQCLGFSAALSATPLAGVRIPMADTRARSRAALMVAQAHGPARIATRLADQAALQSPLSSSAFAALAIESADPVRADRLFAQALALSRHDPILLGTLFERARTTHDRVAELGSFDALARQQLDSPAQDVELARDVSDPPLRAAVVDSLQHGPRWRGHWLEIASGDGAALHNLVPLVQVLETGAAPPAREELLPLIGNLLNPHRRDPATAWQLWRSLSPRIDPLDWDIPAADRIATPFDWTFASHTAPGDKGTITYDNSDGTAPIAAAKIVVLPAGRYRFDARGDAAGVGVRLDCNGQRIDAANGEVLTIPGTCPMARLALVVPAKSGTLQSVRLTLEQDAIKKNRILL